MKKGVIGTLLLSVSFLICRADEGMWLPYLLHLNEKDMQSKGMKISAADIYDINKGSLKDAVVLFGRGCTGEIVSQEGLLLTNHHCGFGQIQAHSSLEKDYLSKGFWAMNRSEELPNPGLTVTLLVEMRDVTQEVLKGVRQEMLEADRNKIIDANIRELKAQAIKGTHYQARITPIYNGNQYLLFINEVFTDIRLVGAPPSNIGKFGGDTDNWMWPRHTGDFSVFRIYTDKDGNPAPYSKDNIPYKPKQHLKISLKDIQQGEFTFVFGYPGTTQQFLTSYAVDMIQNQTNPIAIDLRTKRLDVINRYMNANQLTRIQYAAKAAGIANGWKKWIGENKGLMRLNTIANKQKLENDFKQWASSNPERQQKYEGTLPAYQYFYHQLKPIAKENTYFMEAFYSVEIIRFAWQLQQLYRKPSDLTAEKKAEYKAKVEAFFKDYNADLDREIFVILVQNYIDNATLLPQELKETIRKKGVATWAKNIYTNSCFLDKEKLLTFIEKGDKGAMTQLSKDILPRFIDPFFKYYINSVQPQYVSLNNSTDSLDRVWTAALMQMQEGKHFYPDANLTLRVAYGNVKGYSPADAVNYKHYTTIEGIMQKDNPEIYDYAVEGKLKELYQKKDYGRYANSKGEMPVAFVATNHTTGGNSGSPVLNSEGHLIGLNFDRCWEGTMSDMEYDPEQCRNISLDIRYCLFVIDKFAGAKHLVDEMTIVQ